MCSKEVSIPEFASLGFRILKPECTHKLQLASWPTAYLLKRLAPETDMLMVIKEKKKKKIYIYIYIYIEAVQGVQRHMRSYPELHTLCFHKF